MTRLSPALQTPLRDEQAPLLLLLVCQEVRACWMERAELLREQGAVGGKLRAVNKRVLMPDLILNGTLAKNIFSGRRWRAADSRPQRAQESRIEGADAVFEGGRRSWAGRARERPTGRKKENLENTC